MKNKHIVVLGSSGSIGVNTLRVAKSLGSGVRIIGLAVQRNYRTVLRQAREFGVRLVAVADPIMAAECRRAAPRGVRVLSGMDGVSELACMKDADLVVCAIVGVSGLKPVMAALDNGTNVALATKEVLVAAGNVVTRLAEKRGARLLPIDSEHSAIFQCLQAAPPGRNGGMRAVRRLILTASGGPFAMRPELNMDKVTVTDALRHPRWNMGKKVTVDSATLMNKGLEVMEAHWLFGVPFERIDVVIHPESIVHSLVEFVDGSMLAQMGLPDMRYAIQYALTYPQRVDTSMPRLKLTKVSPLHFYEPDHKRFPCLALACRVARVGGTLPAVLNAANEVAVDNFLAGRMPFSGIWKSIERVISSHNVLRDPTIEQIIRADGWARSVSQE